MRSEPRAEARFDLLLIDLEQHDMRGTDVVRTLKTETAAVAQMVSKRNAHSGREAQRSSK